jgi:hypothetical protein
VALVLVPAAIDSRILSVVVVVVVMMFKGINNGLPCKGARCFGRVPTKSVRIVLQNATRWTDGGK